jgi:hypothetical protein
VRACATAVLRAESTCGACACVRACGSDSLNRLIRDLHQIPPRASVRGSDSQRNAHTPASIRSVRACVRSRPGALASACACVRACAAARAQSHEPCIDDPGRQPAHALCVRACVCVRFVHGACVRARVREFHPLIRMSTCVREECAERECAGRRAQVTDCATPQSTAEERAPPMAGSADRLVLTRPRGSTAAWLVVEPNCSRG